MAKKKNIQQHTPEPKTPEAAQVAPRKDSAEKLLEWIQAHRRAVIAGTAAVAAAAVLGWFTFEYRKNKEQAASEALSQARYASQSGNFPLAANDLTRVIDQFAGTSAADEAVILLAQVRLLQEQPHLAAEELESAVDGLASQFKAPAYGLLGGALENIGRMADAASAFERAAETSWYDAVAAQYLSDAGRAWWAAGDLGASMASYERVVEEYPESTSAVEARVRLGELRAMPRRAPPPAPSQG
jgi:tetratricopeptide (TPR) repeat protein